MDIELLTVEEAAEILKVHFSTVYRMIQRGEMGSVHWGRTVRVRQTDIKQFIESHSQDIR